MTHPNLNSQICREIQGCQVQIQFSPVRNDKVEWLILNSLMGVFESKIRVMRGQGE